MRKYFSQISKYLIRKKRNDAKSSSTCLQKCDSKVFSETKNVIMRCHHHDGSGT